MGSIKPYETAKGKRYRVRYWLPNHTQAEKRGFARREDAVDFLALHQVSKTRGELVNPADAKATINELGSAWLSQQTHLKPSSFRPVEIAWRLYVEPRWGRASVGMVRHSDVRAWISELSAEKGATTVHRAFGVLAAILDTAALDRRILLNPARGVKLPRKTGKRHEYLSHDQVDLLASNAGANGTLVLFLAYTGLRWGEAVGLRVRSVDALRRRVRVQENAVMVGGSIIVGTPKTHEARSVAYPDFLSLPLAKLCEGKSRDALLFGDGVTHMRPPDSRRGWWVRAVAESTKVDTDFPSITRHDLRHTAASLAISAGANVKAVQRMLGHASAAMTLDTYADLFEDDLDNVASALDVAAGRARAAR